MTDIRLQMSDFRWQTSDTGKTLRVFKSIKFAGKPAVHFSFFIRKIYSKNRIKKE